MQTSDPIDPGPNGMDPRLGKSLLKSKTFQRLFLVSTGLTVLNQIGQAAKAGAANLFYSAIKAPVVATVNTRYSRLNQRSYPFLTLFDRTIIQKLEKGSVIKPIAVTRLSTTINGVTAPWYYVEFLGQRGWVWGGYLKLSAFTA